ncbi:branched-chain amino acid ABC transporter substrate-binding protein [Limnohabitans sp. Bal53]|uniref:branched-chain amino acid ABC transporter substrate-binding protein n=1 Tax=Limnohabitans sp. Bal53 TaxID=1977910 RepID=UPI001E368D89|nr:branched-chain amino acid ABC transporter substrate-binding protein [Limnohabitans sp. Bal53]
MRTVQSLVPLILATTAWVVRSFAFTGGLAMVVGLSGAPVAQAATHTVALVSLADDARYQSRRLERRYPGHPAGRLVQAAQLGASDAEVGLRAAGHSIKVIAVTAGSAADLGKVFQQLKSDRVAYWVLDLPEAQLAQAVQVAGTSALLFNASAAADALRGSQCAAMLFHSYPSQAMLGDALAQYLAARSWRNALVLQGPEAADQLQGQAWQRAAKRYGIKTVDTKAFKLSGDPRERDLANTRLLTNDRSHDVVAVMDADGEFARTLPYATQQPRPVVGANGLVALAWHAQWERNGGPQVNRRFARQAQRPMVGQDWAAWVAVKSIAALVSDHSKAALPDQARLLRSGQVFVDGAKGPRLSYRSWDGQLRQPLFLSHVDGVLGTAPLDGVLHPVEVMDTLGVDEKESTCKAKP